MPFATTRMDLESIMLNEISQTNIVYYHLNVESKKSPALQADSIQSEPPGNSKIK